jgi:hypothetical protein
MECSLLLKRQNLGRDLPSGDMVLGDRNTEEEAAGMAVSEEVLEEAGEAGQLRETLTVGAVATVDQMCIVQGHTHVRFLCQGQGQGQKLRLIQDRNRVQGHGHGVLDGHER